MNGYGRGAYGTQLYAGTRRTDQAISAALNGSGTILADVIVIESISATLAGVAAFGAIIGVLTPPLHVTATVRTGIRR